MEKNDFEERGWNSEIDDCFQPNTAKLQGLTRVMGLAIDDDGNFYVSEIFANSPLYRVDPNTGATTKIMDTGMPFIHGLEIIPTPRKSFGITFEKIVREGVGDGTVDMDGDDQVDGSVHYVAVPGSRVIEGNTMSFSGRYHISTHFYSFTAYIAVKVNIQSGSIRGEGFIEEGWLEGARVHLKGKADLTIGYSAGQLRIKPEDWEEEGEDEE